MTGEDLRPIEPLIALGKAACVGNAHALMNCDGEKMAIVTTSLTTGFPGRDGYPSEPRGGAMTFQISSRGKEYLKTAQTLFRSAQAMADRAIADQLKALAEDYERRAEKASRVDAAKAFARPVRAEAERPW